MLISTQVVNLHDTEFTSKKLVKGLKGGGNKELQNPIEMNGTG